jgi:hypothetical protein
MSNLKNFSMIVVFLLSVSSLWAIENINFVGSNPNNPNTNTTNTFRAACIEARAEKDLDINNVRARLRSGGDLWWDGNNARYIVPNVDPASGQPEVSSLFAGGIWLGAFDDGGNLILAAQTYRQTGNDYWTGPLDISTGTIEKSDCEKWDRFFGVLGSEIDALRSDYFEPDPVTGLPDETIDNTPSRNLRGWPGRGNPYFAEIYGYELPDQELAPFIEPPGKEDGIYDPSDGDHPVIEVVGCEKDYFNPVYADQMEWWVYNDNGNIHTNTQGQPMQMEIHGLAFGYRTTDAINNMTFYRYKLLNRNNLALNETYFTLWSDPDLGCYLDDYIGVDTVTGMGYVYNADNNDDATCGGAVGYGANAIPALGVDYFRGPLDSAGNEIGLSSFAYFQNDNDPVRGNPGSAVQHYRLMDGLWLDGRPISRGGTGDNGPGATKFPYVFYSFPAETDASAWSMCTEGITGADYRFLHTSGPFVLKPGAVNELISGVVWVPEIPDYPCPALTELVEADVLAQNLFDDCFKITDGPDAPYIDVIEMENELVLNMNYVPGQNNYQLVYEESPARIRGTADTTYNFQGYKVYQVINENISVTDLDDPDKAREIFQVDLRDSISKVINWTAFSDPDIQAFIPEIMVDGANKGLKHTFQVTEDKFAGGNPQLVNHKPYYFCVVAYAHNEYQKYDPILNTGQALPYLQGRRNFQIYTGIPRPNDPEYNGINLNSSYGDQPEITRIDGKGNGGGLFLDFVDPDAAEADVLNNGIIGQVTYAKGGGPIDVKVVDPLRVPASQFELYISDENYNWTQDPNTGVLIPNPPASGATAALGDSLFWVLKDLNISNLMWTSYQPLSVNYEQYIPELGLAFVVEDIPTPGTEGTSGYIGSSAVYADSSATKWFVGVSDAELPFDMLKTGNAQDDEDLDPEEDYSTLVGGWHPVRLADCVYRLEEYYFSTSQVVYSANALAFCNSWRSGNRDRLLENIRNVNVVLTPNKEEWSRCIVVETANLYHTDALGLSVPGGYGQLGWKQNEAGRDKDGNIDASNSGMSWFPGFAYDVETGERLNIFFGENSFLDGGFFDENIFPGANTGNDMLFNPTSTTQATPPNGFPVFGAENIFLSTINGGQHAIYIAGSIYDECQSVISSYAPSFFTPPYNTLKDQIVWGTFMHMEEETSMNGNDGQPQANGHIPPSKVTFKLRVATPYEIYAATGENGDYPKYSFDLSTLAPSKSVDTTAASALDLISVVPNPYYAYSEYEQTETENVIKVTNLPAKCDVRIYSIEGRLIREYNISQEYTDNDIRPGDINRLTGLGGAEQQVSTSLEWDLKNQAAVPVGSGVYLIHVIVPNVGERVVKSFIINRALDAQKL